MKDLTKKTPSLSDVLELAIDSKLSDLHTSLPGQIESFDPATGYASIKVLIKKKYPDQESAVELPILQDVPVMFPRTKKAFIVFPVEKGDIGHIVFSERSLDAWKSQGGVVEPKNIRKHDISDGVFYLGGYPSNEYVDGYETGTIHIKNDSGEVKIHRNGDLTLLNKVGQFQLTRDGKIAIAGSTGEIVDLLVQILTALETHTHGHPLGPTGPAINVADFTTVKALLESMKV